MGDIIKLRPAHSRFQDSSEAIFRDGTRLDKGVLITTDFLERNEKALRRYYQECTAYPDIWLDTIRSSEVHFEFFPYQRLFLRAMMRYNKIFITACRAASKTFLSILGKYLQCVFVPGHVAAIVAPNKQQATKVTKEKLTQIWTVWPLLEKELESYKASNDYLECKFKNGSTLSVVGALDSSRGLRTHSVFIDEARDQNGDDINNIIIPQMNVSRRLPNGKINPQEIINTQIIYATSAGTKSSYSYAALIDTFESAVIDPKRYFVMGLDYRIPLMHGLLNADLVRDVRLGSSYNEASFAAEYLSSWQGGGEDSWYDFGKLSKYRTIKNPEWSAKYGETANVYYLISVDIGRKHDQTVVTVFRVNIREGRYYSTVVYIEVLGLTAERRTFTQQAIDLKRIISRFNPREVVIDVNGLGRPVPKQNF